MREGGFHTGNRRHHDRSPEKVREGCGFRSHRQDLFLDEGRFRKQKILMPGVNSEPVNAQQIGTLQAVGYVQEGSNHHDQAGVGRLADQIPIMAEKTGAIKHQGRDR